MSSVETTHRGLGEIIYIICILNLFLLIEISSWQFFHKSKKLEYLEIPKFRVINISFFVYTYIFLL